MCKVCYQHLHETISEPKGSIHVIVSSNRSTASIGDGQFEVKILET